MGEMLDEAPGARAAAAAHGGQRFDAASHVGFAAAEPRRLVKPGGAGRFQVVDVRRHHLSQVVDGFRAFAKRRNERLCPGKHLA